MEAHLVELLTEAAGKGPRDDVEHELATEAEQWMLRNGWTWNDRRGYTYASLSFSADPDDHLLIVRRRTAAFWDVMGTEYPVHDFAGALNTLAILHLIHPRFTTFGREALTAHGKVCEQLAYTLEAKAMAELDAGGEHVEHGRRLALKAEGWRDAGKSAAGMYPLKLAA